MASPQTAAQTPAEAEHKLFELLKDFHTAMLFTRGQNGQMHGRPMAIAKLEPDGSAYFATGLRSPKIAEMEKDAHVAISFQSKTVFASMTGTANILRDRQLIDELWQEAWKVWFPGGKDDPNLCLIKVDPSEGEYWDNSGFEGIKYAFEAAKAYLSGEKPATDKKQNAKVNL